MVIEVAEIPHETTQNNNLWRVLFSSLRLQPVPTSHRFATVGMELGPQLDSVHSRFLQDAGDES